MPITFKSYLSEARAGYSIVVDVQPEYSYNVKFDVGTKTKLLLLLSEELPDYSRGETIRPLDFLLGSLEASFREAISKPIDFTEIYRTA